MATLTAFVPLWGIYRLWRTELYALAQKVRLTVASLGLTAALALAAGSVLSHAAGGTTPTAQKTERDLGELAELVVQYRQRYGGNPDEATWANSTGRGDSRFSDLWGRAYVLRREDDILSVGTLGRDGEPGGEGSDEDHFREVGP